MFELVKLLVVAAFGGMQGNEGRALPGKLPDGNGKPKAGGFIAGPAMTGKEAVVGGAGMLVAGFGF
jgi:hypothetical protein